MKNHFLILLVGLMVNTGAYSNVTYLGVISCGSWVKAREEKGYKQVVYRGWLDGYLSGIAVGENVDILKDTDSQSIALWVDNYCKANPLENLANAGVILSIELKKRKSL